MYANTTFPTQIPRRYSTDIGSHGPTIYDILCEAGDSRTGSLSSGPLYPCLAGRRFTTYGFVFNGGSDSRSVSSARSYRTGSQKSEV